MTRHQRSLRASLPLFLAFTCWGFCVSAQTTEAVRSPSELKKLSLDELFDMEVTSVSKKPEKAGEAAAAIHVVTSEDIRRSGALSIPEALRNIPGVEVARVDSRQYAITARGFNSTTANKLLVLIDGRTVYTPLFSGVFWDAQDAFLEDLERIEVIRGPGATVWGANAVNGVINILSKSAEETQGLLVTGGGGNEEQGFGGIRYGGRFDNLFFRVYGKHFNRDDSVRPNGQDAADRFQRSQGGFRADWTAGPEHSFTLQGDLYDGKIDQAVADDVTLSGGHILGGWSHQFSAESDLRVQVFYDRTERNIPSTFGETLETIDLELRHRYHLGQRQDVVWGAGYRWMDDDVTNSAALAFLPAHLRQALITGFLQDEVTVLENRLQLTLGSKFEHNDYSGFEYQPSGRFAWTPSETQTVWGAVSRAVRAPSRIDRDFFVPANPPFLLAGGPNFKSEELHAFELGYRVQPREEVTTWVATFYNLYDNLRSLEGTSPDPLQLANGLEGEGYGVEVKASGQVLTDWQLHTGYSFLQLNLKTKPGSTGAAQVTQEGDSPHHQAFLRSRMDFQSQVEVDATIRYVDRLPNQRVPDYLTLDLRLGWIPTDALEISVLGANLLEPRHPEFGMPATRREAERSVYGKITCRF